MVVLACYALFIGATADSSAGDAARDNTHTEDEAKTALQSFTHAWCCGDDEAILSSRAPVAWLESERTSPAAARTPRASSSHTRRMTRPGRPAVKDAHASSSAGTARRGDGALRQLRCDDDDDDAAASHLGRRAVLDGEPHRCDVSLLSGNHARRRAVEPRRIEPRGEASARDRNRAVAARQVGAPEVDDLIVIVRFRRPARARRALGGERRAQQQPDDRVVAVLRDDEQRRRAVLIRRVGVGMQLEREQRDGRAVWKKTRLFSMFEKDVRAANSS